MAEDRSDSMSRLASRERDKSDAESGSESTPSSEETEESMEGSQSVTDADTGGHPTDDTADSEVAETPTDSRSVNVKDRDGTAFMYLPKPLENQVDLACQSVNLTYQTECSEKLGKNRYLYPIVLMAGVDTAFDLTYEEIVEYIERVDEVEDGY